VKVTLAGMTLDELADLLRAHDMTVSVVHASESRLEDFRKVARDNLADASDFVIVNYDRATLHQEGAGHISPVVARITLKPTASWCSMWPRTSIRLPGFLRRTSGAR
jgi:hypothetical protein